MLKHNKLLMFFWLDVVNSLGSNSDQRRISLSNINAFSVREVISIKDIITQHEFCL